MTNTASAVDHPATSKDDAEISMQDEKVVKVKIDHAGYIVKFRRGDNKFSLQVNGKRSIPIEILWSDVPDLLEALQYAVKSNDRLNDRTDI